MTTNTIAIGKDTILRDVLLVGLEQIPSTGCSEEKIAKLAQKHIPGLPSKSSHSIFPKLSGNRPRGKKCTARKAAKKNTLSFAYVKATSFA